MARVTLNLQNSTDLGSVGARWRFAQGLVPGQPNEGLISQMEGSPARLADYDDSRWEEIDDITKGVSKGFTFAWYRMAVELPNEIDGVEISGSRVFFETNIDNYGEIWIDGQVDRASGVISGNNVQQRVPVSTSGVPGARHVIACLVVNGPLAEPRGGIFMRYATLAFESQG